VVLNTPTSSSASLTSVSPGNYTFKLQATDNLGDSNFDLVNINVMPVNDYNYVQEQSVMVPGVTSYSAVAGLSISAGARAETYSYFDGLGRPNETVSTQSTPLLKDVVSPKAYDQFGREIKEYLPYVSTETTGFYKVNPLGATYTTSPQYMFYSNGTTDKVKDDTFPFAENFFEPSPLNRTDKNYGPGKNWRPAADGGVDKFIQQKYLVNIHNLTGSATDEKVIAWKLDPAGVPMRTDTAVTNFVETGGYYSNNQLTIKVTVDEKLNAVREYTTKTGQLILKKVQVISGSTNLNSLTDWAMTYYVYDDFGNLRYVLPPELNKIIHQNDSYQPTGSDLDNWAFKYLYDGRQRLVEQQLPTAKPVYMVYDDRDRLVLTQDGNQRLSNEWTFIKYDALNRPVLSGKYVNNVSRPTAQLNVNNYYSPLTSGKAWGEGYIGSTAGNILGYENKSYPTAPSEPNYLLAIYYDQYDAFIAPPGYT
jgi:hypothetical protein